MKRITQAVGLAVLVSGLSGCGVLWGGDKGYFRNRGADYQDAKVEKPMQLPEGMQANIAEPLLPVPEHIASLSSKEKVRVPRPQSLPTGAQAVDFFLQQTDQLSWIVAQRIPAQVWPIVLSFFETKGFVIAEENPHMGEFVTQWQTENQLAQDFVSQVKLTDSELVRYRVRIEPGVQRNTSEIFLDSARSSASSDSTPWSAAQADSALALLHTYLEEASETRDSYSLLASRNYDAPKRVAMVDLPNGSKALRIDASLDRAWFGVGRALESAEIYVSEQEREENVYLIDPNREIAREPVGFFDALFTALKEIEKELELDKQRPAAEEAVDPMEDLYRLKLTDIGHQVFVSLEKDAETLADPELTERVLAAIQEQLN